MTKHTPSARALTFHEVKFHITHRTGQQWLRGAQIALALGYKNPENAAKDIYKRNAAEFSDSMTTVVKLKTKGGMQDVRIFSPRGAHLLAMFARTERAAEFRRWVLDILDRQQENMDQRREKPPANRLSAPPSADFPPINVRNLLLSDQSTPTIPVPAEVQSAINRRAWSLAHEAYELCREHLARRVAYTSEMGQPRYLDKTRAFEVITEGGLNEALARTYYHELQLIAMRARTAKNEASKLHEAMLKILEGKAV